MSATGLLNIRVGVSDRVNTALPIWMAKHAGLFEREGLAVEIRYMTGGSSGAQDLQNGAIDIMRVGFSSVLRINERGGNLKCIASMSNLMRFTFFAASHINQASDLTRGVIGVSTFGSETDTTVSFALRKLGLSRDEVRIEEFGDAPRRLAALLSNTIQATAINEPFASEARRLGIRVLLDLVEDRTPWLFSGVVVRASDLSQRRVILLQFMRASIEGTRLALSDERAAKHVLGEELSLRSPESLASNYDDFRKQAPLDMRASLEGAEHVFAEIYPGRTNAAAESIDNSLIDQLEGEGFLDALSKRYPGSHRSMSSDQAL